jgi:flagellar motor switch protein FliN/FliY
MTDQTPPSGEELKMNELQNNAAAGAARTIDFLLDVPLTLSVELGRTRMVVNDLLQLGQGSVVELTKIVGEPLEVLVNEKLIARGEVVVLNDKFAIRLTDIISPKDRLDKLA